MTRTPSQNARRAAIAILAAASTLLGAGIAVASAPLPVQFEGVDIDNKLGEMVEPNIPFTDHTGKRVILGDYFKDDIPVILTLNYYRCESLCSVQLNQLKDGLKALDWTPGEQYRVVTVSFAPNEGPDLALGKRTAYLKALGKGDDVDWHFLTGREKSIKVLTELVGYKYNRDENTGQYAHSPVIYMLSPTGQIVRYLYGISYSPKDIKFSLIEASHGRVGSLGEKILLSCFAFEDGQYAFAWTFMRWGGMLIVLFVGVWLVSHWRRERGSHFPTPAETTS